MNLVAALMSYIVGSALFHFFSPRNQRSGSGNYSCSSCHLYSSNKLVSFYFRRLNWRVEFKIFKLVVV